MMWIKKSKLPLRETLNYIASNHTLKGDLIMEMWKPITGTKGFIEVSAEKSIGSRHISDVL